jgi:cell division protein FtsB
MLAAACLGTIVYVTVSLLGGQNGILAENQLREQKRQISARTAQIGKITDELSLEYTALKNDKDLIAAYARKLDYIGENEKLVKIRGLEPYRNNRYDAGSVLYMKSQHFIPEWFCKALGVIFGGLAYLLFFLIDYSHGLIGKKEKQYQKITGIKVYDIPQI